MKTMQKAAGKGKQEKRKGTWEKEGSLENVISSSSVVERFQGALTGGMNNSRLTGYKDVQMCRDVKGKAKAECKPVPMSF
jgi:hypothetical protein